MSAYNLTRCLSFLRPGAAFGTTNNDYALTEWLDPRPMPTDAECAAAWVSIQAQDAADAAGAQAATANEQIIGSTLDGALLVNQSAIAQNDNIASTGTAWLAANPGASLSLAILTAQVKALTQATVAAANQRSAAARQRNGIIRLVRRKLDSADLNSAARSYPTT